MNRLSLQLLNFIKENEKYKIDVVNHRAKFSNVKDFTNQVGYVIMDVVSKEEKFFDVDRKNIDVPAIAQELF